MACMGLKWMSTDNDRLDAIEKELKELKDLVDDLEGRVSTLEFDAD